MLASGFTYRSEAMTINIIITYRVRNFNRYCSSELKGRPKVDRV